MTTLSDWTPHPGAQTEALQRSEKEILVGGARGGGKTEAGLAWLAEPEYVNDVTYRSLVIRRNYDDLCDWVTRAKVFYAGMGEIIGKPAEIRWTAGGVTRLGHWNDKEALGKYLGHEYHKILIEELTEGISTEQEYLMLLGSCRSINPDMPAQVFCTTNPGNRGHAWVKRRWIKVACNKSYVDPDTGYSRIFIPSTIDDNPTLKKSDPDYVKFLEGLPEPLRSAWRYGSWEGFEGQFFVEFGQHLKEPPFRIELSTCEGHIFGSLDSGTTHATSFGLWYYDNDGIIHRLMTYLGSGFTIRTHAEEIFNRVESYPHTTGYFPELIVADPSMWTKVRLNEYVVRSPIDEYIDLFRERGKKTRFEKANNEKVNGCQIMRMMFNNVDNMPKLRYFDGFNRSFEEGISSVITDKNNVEIYQKQAGDDIADEARYGIVKGYSLVSTFNQRKAGEQPKTHLQRLLAGEVASKGGGADWYNG